MLKRVISLYIVFAVCMAVLLGRIVYINNSPYSEAAKGRTTRTLIVGEKRGYIYDRNYVRLTNSKSQLIAVATPAAGAAKYLSEYMAGEELYSKINEGFPFKLNVRREINNELVKTFSVPVRYTENQTAVHLIGYTDSSGTSGVTGIERAYNTYLKQSSGSLSVSFEADARGRILSGMDKRINDDNFSSEAGVVLTIDSEIQKITEKALRESKIESGCALVMHVDNGEILSMASVPTYDPENVGASLNDENSPLVNKALQSYSVGSVFKPLVAAAALESGIPFETQYECKGEIRVGDTVYGCYNGKHHGKINMTEALEQSCNTYFVSLIMNMDADLLLSLCRQMNLGKADILADGFSTAAGLLPESESISNKGVLANLSFGQGELLMTPVQMLKLYHCLATGNYTDARLVRGIADERCMLTEQGGVTPKKVLSASTVLTLRQMLQSVVEKGNAPDAKSEIVSLSGKTGTAQSGIFHKGREICRTWFAGFFPSDNPHYIVVVLSEKGVSGNTDCAPVFRKICEGIVGFQ